MALAGLDRSAHSSRYVDSTGIINALKDLGFEDIADELPVINQTEDMFTE